MNLELKFNVCFLSSPSFFLFFFQRLFFERELELVVMFCLFCVIFFLQLELEREEERSGRRAPNSGETLGRNLNIIFSSYST